MDRIINIIKIFAEWFVEWFIFITAGVLIICAVNFSLFNIGDLPKNTLLHILLSALLTAAVTTVFFMVEPLRKNSLRLWFVLHFGSLTVTMVVCGVWFGWIDFDLPGIFHMAISVAAVYAFAITVYYILDKHRAEQMNQRLREKYKDDEER